MTIRVETEVTDPALDFDYEKIAEQVIVAALDYEDCPYEAEVDLTLTTDEEIHKVNKEFRGIDRPTDVLSFPLIAYPAAGDFSRMEEDGDNFNPDTGEALLGDIILCVDKIKEQAVEYGHSEQREFAFLILHSMLHLFGYDHMTEPEAAVMEQKQKDILEAMQIYRG